MVEVLEEFISFWKTQGHTNSVKSLGVLLYLVLLLGNQITAVLKII